jgi:putative ABC transport system permease protein
MRALWRVAASDLRRRRLQTFLLFVVVAVAATGITAGLGQQSGASEQWDDAFAEANGAHVAVQGDADALRRLRGDREVVEASGPSPVTFGDLLHEGRRLEDFDVRAEDASRPAIGTPLLYDGRWLSGRDPRELVVERSLAVEEGIEVGDAVRVRGPGRTLPARVVGVALDMFDCPYPSCDSATGWGSSDFVRRLDPDRRGTSSLIAVRIRDPEAVERFQSRVQEAAGTAVDNVLDWMDTRDDALVINRFFAAFLASFGVFLLIAAGIVILSAVSARVLARYRELGILKAVGVTPRGLTLMVLGENIVVASAAAAVGVAAGGLLAPSLQLEIEAVLERGRATFPPGVIALAVVITLAIVAAATLLPAWRAGRVPASRAIARGAGPLSARRSRLGRLAGALRLGAPATVGLKDTGARPLRTWLAVAALAVTFVALVTTLALDRTVSRIEDDPALTGNPFDLEIDPEDASRKRVKAALARQPAIETWWSITDRRAAVGDDVFLARVLGGRPSGYAVHEGRMARRPGEAIAGYGLLKLLDLEVGDRIPLELSGGQLDLRIVGRYAEIDDSGEIVQITLPDLRKVEPEAEEGNYLARVEPGSNPQRVAREIATATGAAVTVEEADTDVFNAFSAAFYVITLLVLAVGLANLFATTALGIRERMHDIGVLKAVGFTPRQVAVSVAVGTAAMALAAAAIGIPLGLLVARLMQETIGRASGIGPEFGDSPAALGVAVAACLLVAVAVALGALVARRAARAPAAEILRAE